MTDGQTIALIAVLVLAGLAFLTLEILTPMFGALVGLGLAALGAAVWLCFTIDNWLGIGSIVALVLVVPAYLTLMVRLLPKSPLGRRIFLGQAPTADADGTPEADENDALVGSEAVTETVLRPAGAIRVGGRRVIATAETGMIGRGERVRILRAHGSNVVVRKIED